MTVATDTVATSEAPSSTPIVAQRASVVVTTPSSVLFRNATWELYHKLREDVDASQQIVYDGNSIEVMASPVSLRHEDDKKLIARLFELYCFIRNVPVRGVGSLTLSSEQIDRGAEADEAYYVLAKPPSLKENRTNLLVHNPPDLVIEIDLTSHTVSKEPAFAAMGIAELWRWENSDLDVRRLRDGAYASVESSVLLPNLPILKLAEMTRLGRRKPQHEVLQRWADQLKA